MLHNILTIYAYLTKIIIPCISPFLIFCGNWYFCAYNVYFLKIFLGYNLMIIIIKLVEFLLLTKSTFQS